VVFSFSGNIFIAEFLDPRLTLPHLVPGRTEKRRVLTFLLVGEKRQDSVASISCWNHNSSSFPFVNAPFLGQNSRKR
jgi:hypothetical protein